MIYLTQRRLMDESEDTIRERAVKGGPYAGKVCRQLVQAPDRYALWYKWHDRRMLDVAGRVRRERQILALRAVCLEQVHRGALVRYLRQNAITGHARDLTLQEFHGVMDPRRAAVAEHKSYLIAASSQLCAYHLLRLVDDRRGIALVQDYQASFGQYFGMFCENARAARSGSAYLLQGLMPDAKAEAEALRTRILGGDGLPSMPVPVRAGAGPRAQRRARL